MKTEEVKLKAETLKSRVKELLGWDEYTYGNYMLERGMDYLQLNCMMPDDMVQSLTRGDGLFWPWFKNIWMDMDADFIAQCQFVKNVTFERRQAMHELYDLTHEVIKLNIYPNRVVFESYKEVKV